MSDLHARILALRRRLHSISLNDAFRPQSSSSSFQLPNLDQAQKMEGEFSVVSQDVDCLPSSVSDLSLNLELRSLRAEVAALADAIPLLYKLAKFSDAIHSCDTALSDLLEHIDSFPATPAHLSSSHTSRKDLPPEEQLSARLIFTKSLIDDMLNQFSTVSDDPRAINEHKRILQTWTELQDMGYDRVHGRKSRPASVISSSHLSSGRNSRASDIGSLPALSRQNTGYSSLSARPSTRGGFRKSNSRRVASTSMDSQSRPSSRISNSSSHRSVTGPLLLSSTLYSSTYASRQRTASLSSSTQTPAILLSEAPPRPRVRKEQTKRTGSPTFSDIPSHPRAALTPSRSSTSTSTSTSTWGRAPRLQFPTAPTSPPPKTPSRKKKKTYIANPKNKLDVAVGDVVNKLPANINIEVVADTWKDQSGKYWIGDEDPKLCFCRILRSQTVMVRVGGGWSELSKCVTPQSQRDYERLTDHRFIKDHFADTFRLLPDSPQRAGAQEEKWISSATLLESPQATEAPPLPPCTPEPKGPSIPSFSLLTPNGHSPRSLGSTPSTGSPLRSLQFIRRADPETRPTTPSKVSSQLPLQKLSSRTPVRNLAWRP